MAKLSNLNMTDGKPNDNIVVLNNKNLGTLSSKDTDILLKSINVKLGSLIGLQKSEIKADKNAAADLQRATDRENALAAEQAREDKLSKSKGALGKAGGVLKSTVGKVTSGSGLLSTLLGGAVLAAIFAPEKFEAAVDAITKTVNGIVNNEFLGEMAKKFIGNLDWSNLFVTGVFGWRAGAVYSAFKFVGSLLADSLGLKKSGDDTGGGEVTIGEKLEGYLRTGLEVGFGAAGIFAALFPVLFFTGVKNAVVGMGKIIGRSWGLGGIPGKDKKALEKSGRNSKAGFMRSMGGGMMRMVRGASTAILTGLGFGPAVGPQGGSGPARNVKGQFISKEEAKRLKEMRTTFRSKLVGSAGKVGRFGLIGIAAGAIAAVSIALLSGMDDEGEDGTKSKMKEGLKEMEGAASKVADSMGDWAMMGAGIGMMFGPLGLAIGAGAGALIGAIVGIFSLTDEEKEKFAKGIATVWDELKKGFLRGVADMFAAILPDSMVPDWVREYKSSEEQKLAKAKKDEEAAGENMNKRLAAAKSSTGEGLSEEDKAKIRELIADPNTKRGEEFQALKKVAGFKALPIGQQGSIRRAFEESIRARDEKKEAEESIGQEERMVEGQIDEQLKIKADLLANMAPAGPHRKYTLNAVGRANLKIEELQKRLASIQGKDSGVDMDPSGMTGAAVSLAAGQSALNVEAIHDTAGMDDYIPPIIVPSARDVARANQTAVTNINNRTEKSVSVSYPLSRQTMAWASSNRFTAGSQGSRASQIGLF